MSTLLCKEEVYAVVGAAMDVYNHLGSGFLEAVYQEALERELTTRNIPFVAQLPLRIRYKELYLNKTYIADLVAYEQVVIELKALAVITKREEAQLINYLNATELPVGILINFGADNRLEWKRLVYTKKRPANLSQMTPTGN
jgi:GxxExxY protein